MTFYSRHSSHLLTRCLKHVRYHSTFEQGDFCILRLVKSNKKTFVGPLEEAGERTVRGGTIPHSSIIGKSPRTILHTKDDSFKYMAHFPTLEE